MKQWLMEILACPAENCGNKLNLDVFTSHVVKTNTEEVKEIDEALIVCPKCGRWYPVIEGIACMLPDHLRMSGKQRVEETKFLQRWKDKLDSSILNEGKPFGLTSTS